jgi:hypothetical protein
VSKKIDWESMYKSPMRGKTTAQGAGYTSRKDQVAKSYQKLEQMEKAQKQFARIEPYLRKSLFESLVNKDPITVIQPMYYWTETLNKSEDEIDRLYYNKPSDGSNAQFQIKKSEIPKGTVLTFSHVDTQMGQWIFKSSNGPDIEIYSTPMIQLPGPGGQPVQVRNDGFWGLMTSTSIYEDVLASLTSESEE